MKHYTPEQLERSLQHSERPLRPLSGEQKRVFLEQLLVMPKPWYQRFWQMWLVVPVAGAAVAGVIWYLNVQAPTSTQLANTNSEPVVNLPINSSENSNSEINVNAETNTNINTNQNANQSVEPTPPTTTIQPRDNHLNSQFYASLGGGGEFDYNQITWKNPTVLPATVSTMSIQGRSLLTAPELQRIASFFPVHTEQIYIEPASDAGGETNCVQLFQEVVTDPCISLTSIGAVHYVAADNTATDIQTAKELIAKATGLNSSDYVVEELGPLDFDHNFKEYRIYYSTSLTSQGLYRDYGWDVYLYRGHLRSLRGYISPQFSVSSAVPLISPTEALERLQAGVRPFDRATNPNTTRLQMVQIFLDELLIDHGHPILQMNSINLEYGLAYTESELHLVPVYYVRTTDTVSGQHLDVYIDPTVDGRLFQDYQLVTL